MKPSTTTHRRDVLWRAALIHRLSGVLLAVFLPLHFLALGLALEGEARLDSFLRWTSAPIVKLAEAILVVLLAVHLLGGLRLLAMEWLPWSDHQQRLALWAAGIAVALGLVFLVRAL